MPSPFAAALLFGYVANYIYDGDAPLAERRAQALPIDQAQLRELLGEAELRELLDADALADVEAQLQQLDERYRARSVDAIHDLLLHLGDLTRDEIAARATTDVDRALATLVRDRRIIEIGVKGGARFIPVEYAARYRDATGSAVAAWPAGIAARAAAATRPSIWRGAMRARMAPSLPTNSPRATNWGGRRRTPCSRRWRQADACSKGNSVPAARGREWCDPDVLQTIRRRSLAKLRKEVEPVEPPVLARLVTSWQGLVRPRTGLDALLDVIEHLQGAPLPASILESDILAGAYRRVHAGGSRRARRGRVRSCGAASSRSAIVTGASPCT